MLFGNQWAKFLSTPGAKSSDPEFNKPVNALDGLIASAEQFIKDKEMDIDDKTQLEAGLADLAADLTGHFLNLAADGAPNVCRLKGPQVLTVEIAGKGYRKESHIGGEEFKPRSAHVGKKGKIILVFEPRSASSYQTAEFLAEDAFRELDGVEEVTTIGGTSYAARVAALNKQKQKIRDADLMQARADVYADLGFGSF